MNNSLPPNTNTAPTEPIQLGHYELHDCIGRGGMGLVYRARDTRLDRRVAIKCLRTELFEHHYVERFKREALLLAKLNHPNIVQIYDFIDAPDQLALVMELVEGQNLQLHLREHIVPFAQRMRWLTEIAQGLAVAHDAGIIHRDLKAENILINQRNVAKITDLGIAKSQHFNATLTDHVAGSYCSMSPEQAMGEAIDFKSDLFSFGILAYQLLCGAHPFGDTNNKLQLMQRIISHPPTAPGKHNPNLPAEINELLGQLLSKDPAKRPDNTHWVAAQFETLSHLQLANDFVSDDTQALIPNGSAANQSNVKNTGINRAVKTQDHPTFETRFVVAPIPKISAWQKIRNYVVANKIAVSSAMISAFIIAGIMTWQLQPKPPKYVAVIPPKLTAEGMQESQQEFVKGAVYDAIQQSVIQLDGYYLIAHNEIADVNGDNETVLNATAADELITTDIQCKSEACKIVLTKLSPDNGSQEGRLRITNKRTVDLLTDNYLSVAGIVQTNIGEMYSEEVENIFFSIDPTEYTVFLNANLALRKNGATQNILDQLEKLSPNINRLSATQSLYRETALELYNESQDINYLNRLEAYLRKNTETNKLDQLNNLYRLEVEKGNIKGAHEILEKLKKTIQNESLIFELEAYASMAQNDYDHAANLYKKAYKIKATANNAYNLANAYWYQGKTTLAKDNLKNSINIAPDFYKSHSTLGLIALVDGDIQQAIESFEKIVAQKPTDNVNINNLGLCYLLLKNYTKAIELFSRATELAPQNSTYQLNKADAINIAGEKTEAEKLYKTIITKLSTEKQSGSNLRTIAQSHAHLGNYPEALTHLKQLERVDPQNIESIYTAALIHTLAGNKESAILNIEESLKAGMNKVWFSFAWFDALCSEQKFLDLFSNYGEPHKCSPPNQASSTYRALRLNTGIL